MMHPVLFYVGALPVRAYSLAVLAAFLAAGALGLRQARRHGLPWAEEYPEFLTWACVGGLLGARLWEVAFQWHNYRAQPWSALAIWEGGLSIQGGVLGGLAAAALFTRIRRIDLGRFIDGAIAPLLLAQAIGRLFGCALNGDAFGKPTGTGFGIRHAPGTPAYEALGPQPLWPAEVMEGLYALLLMALFLRLGPNRGPSGHYFLLYLVLYSAGRFALEFLRADTLPIAAGLTPAQWGAVVAMLAAVALLAWQRMRITAGGRELEGPR